MGRTYDLAVRGSSVAGAGLAVGLAVLVLVQARVAEPPAVTAHDTLCTAYVELATRLQDPPTAPVTPGMRQAAAEVALLASRFPEHRLADSHPAREAAGTMLAVLDSSAPLAYQLTSASRPVAVECGLDWRTGVEGSLPLPIVTPGQHLVDSRFLDG